MKILIDQNISFRLVGRIAAAFSDVHHVKSLGLIDANDFRIFMFARDNDFDAVLTIDEDFYNLQLSHGVPPKIIWLRLHNASVAVQAQVILNNVELIEQFLDSSDADYLELYG